MRTKTSVMFVTTSLNYPIHRKRLSSFIKVGGNFRAIGLDQKNFVSISSGSSTEINNVTVLGEIDPGNYISRAHRLLKNLLPLRKQARRSDVIYASGFESAVIRRILT